MSSTISHQQLRDAFSLAADHLKLHTETLNHLNLFPVADKDTGINMARSLEKTAAHLRGKFPIPFHTHTDKGPFALCFL